MAFSLEEMGACSLVKKKRLSELCMKVVEAFYSFDVDFMNYKYSNLPDTVKYIDQNQEQCDQQSHPRNSKL